MVAACMLGWAAPIDTLRLDVSKIAKQLEMETIARRNSERMKHYLRYGDDGSSEKSDELGWGLMYIDRPYWDPFTG